MNFRSSRLRAGLYAALLLALAPVSSSPARASRSRTRVASAGAVARPFSPRAAERERIKAEVRRRLVERERGTYIGEMLAERDSALARWPDRRGKPLTIWVQWAFEVRDWNESFHEGVRDAVLEWNDVGLPLRLAFTSDSEYSS